MTDYTTLFDIRCTSCKCNLDAESFLFTATREFIIPKQKKLKPGKKPNPLKQEGPIQHATRCLHCRRGAPLSEYAKAKSLYYCALWKMIRVPMLFDTELQNEDRLRRDQVFETIATEHKLYFERKGITDPDDDQMEAVLYWLLAENVNKDIQKEIARITDRNAKQRGKEEQDFLQWLYKD